MLQNVDEFFEIDLTKGADSKELVNGVVGAFETADRKHLAVKLKLADVQISQSQMIFIKSLIESYGNTLAFVETINEQTRNICLEMGLNIANAKFKEFKKIMTKEDEQIDDAKLSLLREEFKAGYDAEMYPDKAEEEIPSGQKQTIGVYRKAEEDKYANEEDETIDFYAAPIDDTIVADTKETIYINQTLRNGQILEYDGNVVIIGDCHPGSEIRATGDITIWGILGSIAHAGMKGNKEAKIRALKMNAVQLRIANCYSRRPDGGNIPFVAKTATFVPEEARIVDDNIVLFKVARN